jgi:hypothetical protein
MSWLKKLFGVAVDPAGGVANAVAGTAERVADIVERWKPSDEKRHQMYMEVNRLVQEAQKEARGYDPRSTGGGMFGEITNILVDSVSRLIRPGVTILLVGGVFGWWGIHTSTLDPIVLGWGEAVIGFWFGARVLFKDIPQLILAVKASRQK